MQSTYAQKNETIQKASANTAESVVDSSSQSATLQRHASLANAAVQRAENPPRPNNTGLPDDLKNGVESLSGYSLDNVRVHYNSPKPATVQALAYTQGNDIHVAPGQEHALPHEAWHVTQQMAGRVTPTTNIGGMPVNDNAALEHEADVMGEKAVTQRKVDGSASSLKSVDLNGKNGKTLQCLRIKCGNDIMEARKLKDLIDANMKNAISFLYTQGKKENESYITYQQGNLINKLAKDAMKLGKNAEKNGSILKEKCGKIDVFWGYDYGEILDMVLVCIREGNQENDRGSEQNFVNKKNRRTFCYEDYFTPGSASWLKVSNDNLIKNAQINSMIANNRQGPFNADSIGLVYHIEGPYPSCGKPLWQIEEGKVKILGMYHHPNDSDNTTYKCNISIEGNYKTIKIF